MDKIIRKGGVGHNPIPNCPPPKPISGVCEKRIRLDSLPGNLCLTLNEDYECHASDISIGGYGAIPMHIGKRVGPMDRKHSYVNMDYVKMLAKERDKLQKQCKILKKHLYNAFCSAAEDFPYINPDKWLKQVLEELEQVDEDR